MDWTFALRKLLNPDLKKTGTFKDYTVATRKEQLDYLKTLIDTTPKEEKSKKKSSNQLDQSETKDDHAIKRDTLMENPMTDNSHGRLQPVIRVDGPYGSASEEVFDFNTLMLVGAGIGVTPFASILRSLVARQKLPGNQMPKVYFFWLCRSPQEFNSFKALMQDTISRDKTLRDHFEFNLYMSGETNINSESFKKTMGEFKNWCNLYTGRPNWKRIFGEKKKNHPNTNIGVFLCGPPAIGAQLDANSRKFSDPPQLHNGTKFISHKENF